MASYLPQSGLREACVQQGITALLIIDVQKYNCSKSGAIYRAMTEEHRRESEYFFSMIPELLQNLHSLREKCVDKQVALFQAVIQSLRQDGADRGLDYKISGFHVPPNSDEAAPLLDPVENEIVLAKTSSSVFLSTNIDYILRSMKIEHLIMAGCLTDQCVEHAVRDACDLGYLVTLVVDGSLTYSQERHEASLRAVGGYCRHRTVAEMIVELGNI